MHEKPQTYCHVVAPMFLQNRGLAVLCGQLVSVQRFSRAGKRHTGTVPPSLFLHQVVQLRSPVTGMLRSSNFNASVARFAPYVAAIG